MTSRSTLPQPDTASISLTRLLSRLEHTLLSSDASPRLRKSSYERTKVGQNLEYARSLLLKLEHDSTRKQAVQSSLQSKRALLKQLNQRLYELNQLDDDSTTSSASSSDAENDDLFPSYAPAAHHTFDTIDQVQSPSNPAPQQAAANLSSTLRSRKPQAQPSAAATTSSALFSQSHKLGQDASLVQTESLLSHNRTEQEALTTSLLSAAQELKSKSLQFGSSLEFEKSILDRAVEGLDKNAAGMEAAGQRMGTLRRMTEGKGWLARLKLYGMIFGLWVLAFLIVFVGPKLRF
ncbi:hypothetical protein K432DRAFT_389782 [Lepidopterella palustris CBS 459.81]|uniref:Synaptobrevin n=1 Tax=Lepidopterella palustris CBS 459.81 TaxID=1314670 RepID=A0A8E2EIC4_9PEZI|nr:hypothetical protein K432DRAFT_389782 [Lepidopterella palustris CBS 459.81]